MNDKFNNNDGNVTNEEWSRILGEEVEEEIENPDDEYQIGHCRPPRHSQFKPGQSGNPGGRPKNKTQSETQRDLHSMVWKAAMTPIATTIDGRQQTVSALQAIYYKTMSKAMEGHAPSIRFAHELARSTLQEHGTSQSEMYEVALELIEELDKQPEGKKNLETIRLLEEVMARVNATLSDD